MLFLTVNIRNLIFEKQGRIAPLSGYKRRRLYMSGAYIRDYRVRLHVTSQPAFDNQSTSLFK